MWEFSAGSFSGLALLHIVANEPLVPWRVLQCCCSDFIPPVPSASGSITTGLTSCVCVPPLTVTWTLVPFVWPLSINMTTTWTDTSKETSTLAGLPAARNEAPLRLVSWLSFRLSDRCHAFIQAAPDGLCFHQNLLTMGRAAFPTVSLVDLDSLQEVLLSEVALAGMSAPLAEVRELFETFLRELTLPRLIHFFDLVLAQMLPRWEASAGPDLDWFVMSCVSARMPGRGVSFPALFAFRFDCNFSLMLVFVTQLSTGRVRRCFSLVIPLTLTLLTPRNSALLLHLNTTERTFSWVFASDRLPSLILLWKERT